MRQIEKKTKSISNIILVFVLLLAQLTPISLFPQKAVALGEPCSVNLQEDLQGANDEPGQKDLNIMCVDDVSTTSIDVAWNWDETSWSGSNTGDACALFDTDGDDNANYAVCVTVSGSPATQRSNSPRIYSCNDANPEKCSGDSLIAGPYATKCSVSQSATDPFSGPGNKIKGASYPNDTRANCTVVLSEVGGEDDAELVDVCSFPSQQPNSDPSDCIIFDTGGDTKVIEVIKDLNPNDDGGTFSLKVEGLVKASNVGDGGSTGEIVVDGTGVAIEEVGTNGTLLSNYTTRIECYDDENPGSAAFYTSSPVGGSSRSGTVTFPGNGGNQSSDVTCYFINTRNTGTLRVIKDVVNDNGGTSDYTNFTFNINGTGDYTFNPSTAPDGTRDVSLATGTYSVTENEADQNGYATTYNNCTNVAVVANQITTCTIINNDIAPKLTLTKSVTNNNGGNAVPSDFALTVGGNSVVSGASNTYQANTALTINETQATGYSFVSISGSPKCPSTLGGSVTLAPGDDITCTITNDDIAPTLTIEKKVVNDNGGTLGANSFGIKIGNSDVVFGSGVSNGSMTTYSSSSQLSSNTNYTISEQDTAGYSEGTWSCSNGAQGTGLNVIVSLNEGQNVTCTVTNNDTAPLLTLVKLVTNDNGGSEIASAWTLIAQAGTTTPIINEKGTVVDGTDGLEARTNTVSTAAGVFYSLSEQGPAGYSSGNWSCDGGTGFDGQLINTVILALGDNITCSITNNDEQAYIIVDKTVINDNGGNASPNAFNLKVGNNAVLDGVAFPVNPGTYTVSETNLPGYTAGDWGTDCTSNGSVTVALGQTKTCTITNNDQQAYITVVKEVNNNNGGTANPDDFSITLGGNSVSSGVPVPVNPGSYTAGETLLSGYEFDGFSGDCNSVGTVTVALGERKTCTLSNEFVEVDLELDKDDNGIATEAGEQYSYTLDVANNSTEFSATEVQITDTLDNDLKFMSYSGTGWTCVLSGADVDGYGGLLACNYATAIAPEGSATTLTITVELASDTDKDFIDNSATVTSKEYEVDPDDNTDDEETPVKSIIVTAEAICKSNFPYLKWGVKVTNFNPTQFKLDWLTQAGNQAGDPADTLVKTDSFGLLEMDYDVVTETYNKETLWPGANTVTPDWPGWDFVSGVWIENPNDFGGNLRPSAKVVVSVNPESDDVEVYPPAEPTCNPEPPANLTLVKDVINDNGGTALPSDWTLTAEGKNQTITGINGATSVTNVDVLVGTEENVYTLSESGQVEGYEASEWLCVENPTNVSGYTTGKMSYNASLDQLTLQPGADVRCAITNNDIAPQLKVFKYASSVNEFEQKFNFELTNNQTVSPFSIEVASDTYSSSYKFDNLSAGQVTLEELDTEGWETVDITCYPEKLESRQKIGEGGQLNSFVAKLGGRYVCYVSNNELSTVTVTKFHDKNKNGKWDKDEPTLSDWEMNLDQLVACDYPDDNEQIDSIVALDSQPVDGGCQEILPKTYQQITDQNGDAIFEDLSSGDYLLTETEQEGWEWTNTYCDPLWDGDYSYNRGDLTGDNKYVINKVSPGESVNCYVGNYGIPRIETTIVSVCKNDFPYLQWNVKAFNIDPTKFTLDWFTEAGNEAGDPASSFVTSQEFDLSDVEFDNTTQTFSAETLWPGANDDPNNPDWPGWVLNGDQWIADPTDFGGNLRPSALVTITINPTDEGTSVYPPPTPKCNANPPQGNVLGDSDLPNTGSGQIVNLAFGITLVAIAIGLNRKQFTNSLKK